MTDINLLEECEGTEPYVQTSERPAAASAICGSRQFNEPLTDVKKESEVDKKKAFPLSVSQLFSHQTLVKISLLHDDHLLDQYEER